MEGREIHRSAETVTGHDIALVAIGHGTCSLVTWWDKSIRRQASEWRRAGREGQLGKEVLTLGQF